MSLPIARRSNSVSTVIIGACHWDTLLKLSKAPVENRTNSASAKRLLGGVAANIMRHIALANGGKSSRSGVTFIGATCKFQVASMTSLLAASGAKPRFAIIDAPEPSYTAILDNNGDLVIGAACMDLYDAVTPTDIIPLLPNTGCVVMDANFPEMVLGAVADILPMAMSLYAAGTSVEKVQRLTPILDRLDGLVVNRAEAERLTEVAPLPEMAADIAGRMRPRAFTLISDGGNEAVLAQDGIVVTAMPPAFDPDDDTINVNGAGDAMAARLFGLYLHGASRQRPTGDMLDSLLQTALSAGAAFAAGETNA